MPRARPRVANSNKPGGFGPNGGACHSLIATVMNLLKSALSRMKAFCYAFLQRSCHSGR
jgi:hypothetical protein